MKDNKVKVLSLLLGCALSSQASAEVLKIDSIKITSGTLVRSFMASDTATPIVLDLTGNTDLVSGFINKDTTTDKKSISQTNFKMVKDPSMPTQYVYTAASNINHNSEWKGKAPNASGTLSDASYVVPTGTVDDEKGTITLDLSSWFANHMMMDQNLGGIATGQWDPATNEITDLTWDANLSQGMNKGATTTWTLQGKVLATSPATGSTAKNPTYSFKSRMLEIPAVDIIDKASDTPKPHTAKLQLVDSKSGDLVFELIEVAPVKSTSENPTFSFESGILIIPTIDITGESNKSTPHSAKLELIESSSEKMRFKVKNVRPK